MKEKSRVIVYGAGEGGRNFIERQKEYEILAIVDTFATGKLGEFDIVSPLEIVKYEFDYIIITSMFSDEIISYLTINKIVPREKIKVAPKNYILQEANPFLDETTYRIATKTLNVIINLMNKYELEYFISGGTLLGLVREQAIIKHDNDIDFDIRIADSSEDLFSIFKEVGNKLSEETELDWKVKFRYTEDGALHSITIDFDETETYKNFDISFRVVQSFTDSKVRVGFLIVDKEHYESCEYLNINNLKIRTYNNYKGYLKYVYGNWEVPDKDFGFSDYPEVYKLSYEEYKKHKIVTL